MRHIHRAIKLWAFVLALSFFVVIGSIAVHEIGHATAAAATGCTVESVVLYNRGESPSTYIICNNNIYEVIIALSGMAFNIIFGIAFLFAGKPLIHNMAFMFFGFALYSGKIDLQLVGFPVLFSSLISLAGIGLMIYALYLICKVEAMELFKPREVLHHEI